MVLLYKQAKAIIMAIEFTVSWEEHHDDTQRRSLKYADHNAERRDDRQYYFLLTSDAGASQHSQCENCF